MGKRNSFCLHCDVVMQHECEMTHNRLELVELKRTRWGRFLDKFWSIDWSWCLAFMGLAVMNAILIPHIGLTFKESLGESLALGFAIPRLIKEIS